MLQPCYRNGIERRGFEALGIGLAPLILYHARVLSCAGNPYFIGGPATDADLVYLVSICACPTRDEVNKILYGDPAQAIAGIVIKATPEDFEKARATVEEYLTYYTERPERKEDRGGDGRIYAPWWGMLKSYLTERCGYTNAEAWDCVVCEAFAEIGWYGARHDDRTLLDEFAIDLRDRFRRGEYVPPTQEEIKRMMFGGG